MTCIRSLQAAAGRIGRQLSDEYARAGETASVQELRSEETRALRAIEQAHRDGPCRCEACSDEVPW